jgi:uncharacterized membrane protein YvbJ
MQRRKEMSFMFCPSCGADGQAANAFCKRCGDWLPEFKRRSSAFGGETPQQNVFMGLFMSALSAVVALFSAIALSPQSSPGSVIHCCSTLGNTHPYGVRLPEDSG